MFLGKTTSGKFFLVRHEDDVKEQIAKQLQHVEDKKAIQKKREDLEDEQGALQAAEIVKNAEDLCNKYYVIDDSDPPVLTEYK